MITGFEEEDFDERWERETAEVEEPIATVEGEVIEDEHPGQPEPEFPFERFITKELCGVIFAIPGNFRARQTGHEWWRLEKEEKQLLGEASQPGMVFLARKYLSDGTGVWAPLMIALAVVYGPRQFREASESKQDRDNKNHPQGSGPIPHPSMDSSAPSWENEDVASQSSSSDYQSPFAES